MPANIKEYKNPAATASMLVAKDDEILLVKRKHNPYAGMWALPGGFLDCDKESLEETAVRELKEETPFVAKVEDLELLCVNSSPTRDPRGHVIDHVYLVKKYLEQPHENGDYDDAVEIKLFYLNDLPPLAFDHAKAIERYKTWRRKNKL